MARPTFVQVRSALLFLGGLAGVGYVTVIDQTERPTLLILFAAMMGLPLFLRADEKDNPMPPPPPPPQLGAGDE